MLSEDTSSTLIEVVTGVRAYICLKWWKVSINWDRHHNNILNVILLIHVDVLSPVNSALFNIVMIGA